MGFQASEAGIVEKLWATSVPQHSYCQRPDTKHARVSVDDLLACSTAEGLSCWANMPRDVIRSMIKRPAEASDGPDAQLGATKQTPQVNGVDGVEGHLLGGGADADASCS